MFRFLCISTVVCLSTAVFAQPCSVNAGADVTICLGQTTGLGGNPTAGVSFGINPDIDWNNGANDVANPVVSPTSTTTYTVTVSGGICGTQTDQVVVTVLSPSLTGAQLTNYQGEPYFVQCVSGGASGLIFVNNGNPDSWNNAISSYSINWGDGSPVYTTNNGNWPQQNHSYSPGLYNLTYTITGPNGCQASTVYKVFVGNTPAVGLNIPMNTEGCIPITVSFPITNTLNNVPGTTYTVTFSDDWSQQTFVHPPPASVTHAFMQSSCGSTFQNGNILEQNAFGVTIQAQNPCGSSSAAVGPIRLSEPPVSSFTATPQTACTNGLVTITNTSNAGSLVTGTSCSSNAIFYWQISPSAGWNLQSGSLGSSNGFAVSSFAGWTQGSSSLGINFSTPGTYTVTQTIANGCGPSTFSRTICVIPPPTCNFTVNANSGCGPLNVVTNNNSTPPLCNGSPLNLNYSWNVQVPSGGNYTLSGGTLSSANPSFNLTNTTTVPLTYTITQTVFAVNPQTGANMTDCSSTCNQVITVHPAPVISSHPTPTQTICVGGIPSALSVAYQYGVGTPTYQWYSNTANSNSGGTLIPGATSANYTPPALNTAGTYCYYAVISLGGSCGTITSNPACVLVVPDPTISTQPQASQTICAGGAASPIQMSYSNGIGTPTYQWFTNTGPGTSGGTPVAGATSASFTPTVPSTPGTYYFYGTVSLSGSGCGTATTASAQVIVIGDPVISIPTATFTYCQNAPATPVSTNVSGGNGTNSYQWFQTTTATNTGGTPVSGQTGASFTPSTATVGTQYYYVQLTQSTSGCSAVSQSVTVTILPSASISSQPAPSTVCVGGVPTTLTATFVNGTGTPSYQWFSSPNSNGSNSVSIAGATASSYVPPTNTAGTVYYFVTISFTSGGCSSISSSPAAVTVVPDPLLSLQSASTQELCVGGSLSAALSVILTGGTGTASYQWYSNTSAFNTGGTAINGATNATYTPPPFTASGTFYYYAAVSSTGTGCDAAASAPAAIVVVNDPVVSAQPLATQTVCQNSPAAPLSVSVTGGSGTATISWFSNTTNSTTGGTLIGTGASITPATSTIGTVWYYAIINQSASGCAVTSATGSVTVTPAPAITSQPQPSTVCVGGSPTTMSVSIANGLGTPTYQWFSSPNSNGSGGTSISGATNSTFVPPAQVAGSTYYYVQVSFSGGACSNLTSSTALVQVIADSAFSVQPSSPITVCQGTAVPSPLSFSVQGGTGVMSYQWYSNVTASASGGTPVSGANGTTYSPAAFSNSGIFYFYATVSATGSGCETVSSAVVTVNVNPAATASVLGPFSSCGASPVPVSATSSGTGTWSAPPGAGTFGNATSISTTFTPASASSQTINLTWITSDPDAGGPCPAVSASSVLTIFPPATANLNPTASVCTNAVLNLSATTNSPGSWTTTGSGTLASTSNPVTTYTPGAGDVMASPITVTWTTADPDGSGPCTSVSASQTITVNQPPVVNAGPDLVLCLNSGSTTLQASPVGGTWTGTGVSSSGQFNPVNPGTFQLSYTFTDANNCSASDPITVNVNQSAIADANGPYSVCGLAAISISASTNGSGTWTGGQGVFANASNPVTTYTPAPTEVGTTITLVWETFDPDGSGPCTGAIDNTTLTVSTPASAAPGGPYTICSSDIATISVTSVPATGSWTGGTGTYGSTTSSSTTYDPSSSESPAILTLTWTTTDPDGVAGPCPAVSASVTVNVLEAAIADANGPYATCGATPITLSATTNGSGTWTGGLGVFSNASNPVTTYTPTPSEVGTTITLVWETFDPDGSGPCSGAFDNTQLTISTPATATPGGPYTICSSDIATISVTSVPAAGSWTGGAGTYGSTASSSTTYDPSTSESPANLTLTWTTTDPDGGAGPCPAVSASVTVNVLEAAIADANGPYSTCGATPIPLSATTNGSGTWAGGQGVFANASNPVTTYTPTSSEVGTTITLVWETFDPDGNGPCSGAFDNTQLTISTPASATPSGPYTICSSDVASISVTTTPSQGSWAGGAGTFSNSSNSSTTYDPSVSESGTTVTLVWTTLDPDGIGPCPAVTANVLVNVLEEAIASISGPLMVCANSTIEITAITNGAGEWTYNPMQAGSISNSQNSTTLFTPSVPLFEDQQVTLTWTTFDPDGDGPCSSISTSDILNIESIPEVQLTPTYAIDCGDPISGVAIGGSGAGYSYSWSPTTGIVSPGSSTTPVNASGTYTLTVTDGNNCSNNSSTVVTINALDNMAQANDAQTCLNEPVTLIGTPTLGAAPFSYLWQPNTYITPAAGTTSEVVFTYNLPIDSDLTVSLTLFITDSNGCADSEEVLVLVHPLPVVHAGPDISLCQESESFEITGFSPHPSSGLSSMWSPSAHVDPASLQVGSNSYTYTFTDLNGCTNQDVMNVVVHELPQANFNSPLEACEGTSVLFTNTSQCSTCGGLSYEWDFGINQAGSIQVSPTYTYQDTGYFQVNLSVVSSFGCANSVTQPIHILALPETSFTLSTNEGCGPLDVQVTNTSVGGGVTFNWTIDPFGSVGQSQPGLITFPSAPCDSISYGVQLAATNLCGTTTYFDDVLVYGLPQPAFVTSADTICSAVPLSIFNTTACAWQTQYLWSMGDGSSSSSQNQLLTHTYFVENNFGVYPLTLTASNPCGVVQVEEVITVVPNEIIAFFSADPLTGCEPLTVNFDQQMNGVTYFTWDFGNGQTSLIEDPQNIYLNDGLYEVTFIAGNFCGAQDTASIVIQVLPSPEFNFVSSEQFLCVGESATFNAFGDPIGGFFWQFGDGTSSVMTSPTHIFSSEGDFEVSLTAISLVNGCPNTTTNTINVLTTPNAQITVEDAQGCPPFQVTFANSSTNAINYFWNLGDGNNYIGDSLVYSFQSEGSYSVQVVAINENSCSDTSYVNITVYPSPTADFTYSSMDYNGLYMVNFTNNSANAIAYQWALGDGTNSFQTHPYKVYEKGAECFYFPTLVAYNAFGCKDTARSVVTIPFDMEVFIPNSFTPNGDNLNDLFTVYTSDVDPGSSHLRVIDRWGVTVYEAFGNSPGWDGYIAGELAPNAVYQYIYTARLKCGIETFRKVGHLTLVR